MAVVFLQRVCVCVCVCAVWKMDFSLSVRLLVLAGTSIVETQSLAWSSTSQFSPSVSFIASNTCDGLKFSKGVISANLPNGEVKSGRKRKRKEQRKKRVQKVNE